MVLRVAVEAAAVGQELVDSVVGAVDVNRCDEVARVQLAMDGLGLGDAFQDELRLSGVPSVCDDDCWVEAA